MKAKSILTEGYRSVINDSRGHEIITDMPESNNGNDTGPTALELTVMSLAGCITTIFGRRPK